MSAWLAIWIMDLFPRIGLPALGPKAAHLVGRLIVLLLIGLALYAAYSWAWNSGRDEERAKWEAAAEHLEDADAAADAEAIDVAHETKETFDATNQRAADAAAQSDDPLAAGFSELRGKGERQGD